MLIPSAAGFGYIKTISGFASSNPPHHISTMSEGSDSPSS